MNQSIRRFTGILMLGLFLMGACQAETPALLPITGSNNKSSLPARVVLAHESVLEYVLDSRLTDIPSQADWQLQEIRNENEYNFHSGDWLMVIRAPKDDTGHQWVVILNRVEKISWTGYMTADGRVVDTAYGR